MIRPSFHRLRGPLAFAIAVTTPMATPARMATDQPKGSDVWAIGYSVYVVRTCPEWTMKRQDVLARRGILPRQDIGSAAWRTGGALQNEYYSGMTAAEGDHGRNAGFCNDLEKADQGRWRRLSRILARRPSD